MIALSTISALLLASSVLATRSVSVSFVDSPATAVDVDNLIVSTRITNTGDETLRLLEEPRSLLTPNWPTETFESVLEELKPHLKVKHSPSVAAANKAFLSLAPGSSVDLTHSLGGVYNFSATGSGLYTLEPSSLGAQFSHLDTTGELITLKADVPSAHQFHLAGKLTPKAYLGERSAVPSSKHGNKFVGCSTEEQTQLKAAAKNAQTYADDAFTYLLGHPFPTPRFVTWFGTWTSKHFGIIFSHYHAIHDGQLATDTFDCSTCTDPAGYVYAYPEEFGTIYLCGMFWKSPATGTDSQAGILIHASSLFAKNGDAQDYVDYQSTCQALAISNSSAAIENADSHEYFAENNPKLF